MRERLNCPKCGKPMRYTWLKNSSGMFFKWSCDLCRKFYNLDFEGKNDETFSVSSEGGLYINPKSGNRVKLVFKQNGDYEFV